MKNSPFLNKEHFLYQFIDKKFYKFRFRFGTNIINLKCKNTHFAFCFFSLEVYIHKISSARYFSFSPVFHCVLEFMNALLPPGVGHHAQIQDFPNAEMYSHYFTTHLFVHIPRMEGMLTTLLSVKLVKTLKLSQSEVVPAHAISSNAEPIKFAKTVNALTCLSTFALQSSAQQVTFAKMENVSRTNAL